MENETFPEQVTAAHVEQSGVVRTSGNGLARQATKLGAIDDLDLEDEDLAGLTTLASEDSMLRLWDTPEEVEAWRDL